MKSIYFSMIEFKADVPYTYHVTLTSRSQRLLTLSNSLVTYTCTKSHLSYVSNFQENAVNVICAPVMDTLDCVIYADNMTVLKMPTGLRRSILALYVIIVHRLHNTDLPDSVC